MPFMISPAIPIIVDGRRLRNSQRQRVYEQTVSDIVRKLCDKSRVGKAIIEEIVHATNLRGGGYRFVTIEPQREASLEVLGIGPKAAVNWQGVTPEIDT